MNGYQFIVTDKMIFINLTLLPALKGEL